MAQNFFLNFDYNTLAYDSKQVFHPWNIGIINTTELDDI